MASLSEEKRSVGEDEAEEEAFLLAMQLTTASVVPMTLKAAIELEVLEVLAKAGEGTTLSAADIAAQLPTTNSEAAVMVERMLGLLAAYSVVTCSLRALPDGRTEALYSAAPVCKFLTRNVQGVSLAPMCLMCQDKVFMESWYYVRDAVLQGGIPFHKAHGVHAFEYYGSDPRFNRVFNEGISQHSAIITGKILGSYDGFRGLSSLVDVGGGTGAALNAIVRKYSSIRGINFDLPHVIQDAPVYPGIDHVAGDMFTCVPRGDAILLKWVCHNWGDDHCLKILTNCYRALPLHGKVIVAECMLSDASDTGLAAKNVAHLDVIMMANYRGGKQRTLKQFQSLGIAANFRLVRFSCRVYSFCILEFLKEH